jgi:lipopolysaccharide transport system ATP-binding protein
MIIDEGLAVGDALFVPKCMLVLRSFTTHETLLFVSHDTAAVFASCDRAIWSDSGLLAEGGRPKLVSEACLTRMHYAAVGSGLTLTRTSSQQGATNPPPSRSTWGGLPAVHAQHHWVNDVLIFTPSNATTAASSACPT